MLRRCSLTSALREQDRVNVHRAVQDVQHCHFIPADLVENQVAPVHAALDVLCLISWDDRPGLGEVSQIHATAPEFADKADRAGGIVPCDVVADGFQIRLGLGGDLDDHFAGLPIA